MRFSVIVVCYNAGEKLYQTVESILDQTCQDYEVIVKDGMSTDDSFMRLEKLVEERERTDRIKTYRSKDSGIYDAMNEAVRHASGDYFVFLNCGDLFYDAEVLQKFSDAIDGFQAPLRKDSDRRAVLYGNRFLIPTKSTEYVAPNVTPLVCYRNIPCHQCCFYSASCFRDRGYRTDFKVRADYEHFLWLYFSEKAEFYYVNECVAKYEGGGYSENPESVRRSGAEHRAITRKYMTKWQLFYCRLYMVVTLQPLRRFMASNPKLSGFYNRITRAFYGAAGGRQK